MAVVVVAVRMLAELLAPAVQEAGVLVVAT
jgi:hypothetical protein